MYFLHGAYKAFRAEMLDSRFTGGAFANFFIGLLTLIVSVITLTLAYPAMKCWKMR